MSDLFDPLRPALREHAVPTPASEVRRRGDRLRRRRTVGTAIAGMCAVVAIAGAGAAVTGQFQGSPPPAGPATQAPAPTPSQSSQSRVMSTIPRGFPLDTLMATGPRWDEERSDTGDVSRVGPERDLAVLTELQVCADASPSPADTATDQLGVGVTSGPLAERRDLSLYPDVATARQSVEDWVGKFEACPSFETTASSVSSGTALTSVAPGELGDESWVVTRTFEEQTGPVQGQEVVHLVRVGPAVLIAHAASDGPGGSDRPALQTTVEQEAAKLGPVLDSLME